jgi:hypothetical protein
MRRSEGLALVVLLAVSGAAADDACSASDAQLLRCQHTICASLGAGAACPGGNATAEGDWPNQAIYMRNLLAALVAAPPRCLNSSAARGVLAWLDVTDAAKSSWWNTWNVFQVQYYDMPHRAGARVETPATLGRKCWAFAYLAQAWDAPAAPGSAVPLKRALPAAVAASGSGQSVSAFVSAYAAAVPLTMGLCARVMANCFVNASYAPALRNGTCPGAVGEFYVGFQWENGASVKSHDALAAAAAAAAAQPLGVFDDDSVITRRNDSVAYPFPRYTQTDAFREAATLAVNTALNFII